MWIPSDLEGMPLSLLEAMSFGNCCVTSNISECTEVVENKAVSFKKADVESLKNTLQNLLDNPTLVAGFQNSSADYICSKYNWDAITGKTLEIYRR